MSEVPTVAPTAEMNLFGEKHIIRFTFRSYEEIGINPFDKQSIEAYNAKPKDLRALAATVRAGLLHEYFGRRASRKGEDCPTVDEIMDELDPITYVEIWMKITRVMGVDEDAQPEAAGKPEDPPQA